MDSGGECITKGKIGCGEKRPHCPRLHGEEMVFWERMEEVEMERSG